MTIGCNSLSGRLLVFSQLEALSEIDHVLDRELDVLGAGSLRGDHARFLHTVGKVSSDAVGEVTLLSYPTLPFPLTPGCVCTCFTREAN